MLRGVALLSRGEVLATLPSEEALPLTDRQAERERERVATESVRGLLVGALMCFLPAF